MAQQENAPNKPVHLMFLTGTIVAFYLAQWTIDWIWGYFAPNPGELYVTIGAFAASVTAAIILYRHNRVYQLANEVAIELGKVTWPTAKEVRAATIVVVVMSLLAALILGAFDTIWSSLTEVVYG